MIRTQAAGCLRFSINAVAAPEKAPPTITTSYSSSIAGKMMDSAYWERNRALSWRDGRYPVPQIMGRHGGRPSSRIRAVNQPRLIDLHVHMVGNGGGGSGGWLRLNGWHRWLAGFMLRQLGIPASALEENLEAIYAEHLSPPVRDSSMDAVVLLAHEPVHDPDGTPREDLG